MRALLTPEIVPRLGVVLLKPGSELFPLFTGGRVLVERQPEHMASMPTGRVPDARQPLAENKSLEYFSLMSELFRPLEGLTPLKSGCFGASKSVSTPTVIITITR